MSDNDLDEEETELEEPELEDADDLEEEDDLEDDALAVDDDAEEEEDDTAAAPEVVVAEPAKAAAETTEEEDVVDLDEELHPDDVEEPLDVLLQERTASATRIVPRRPGEFLCASCFLVLPRSQLADSKRMLCRDCA